MAVSLSGRNQVRLGRSKNADVDNITNEGTLIPADLPRDSVDSQIGRIIYKEFMTVVSLQE